MEALVYMTERCSEHALWDNGACGEPECCGDQITIDLRCDLAAGHEGDHRAPETFDTPKGARVLWSIQKGDSQ